MTDNIHVKITGDGIEVRAEISIIILGQFEGKQKTEKRPGSPSASNFHAFAVYSRGSDNGKLIRRSQVLSRTPCTPSPWKHPYWMGLRLRGGADWVYVKGGG
ncbi:hypothetical protein AOLI_G00253880 [Acnodon oligacanthus]